MSKRLAGLILASCWATAQEPSPVFRVTVGLVQVDAIVTDSAGRQVADLQPGDFEVLQDGKRQKIAYFSYVETGSQPGSIANAQRGTPSMPSIPLRPEDTRRVIALVVDDLGIRPPDQVALRKALDNFIDRQLQSGDLVAVVQTGRGSGLAAHQFSNDKRVLHAAVAGLQASAANRTSIAFEPKPIGVDAAQLQEWRAKEESNRAREEALGIVSLDAAASLVRGMSRLPGRKSLVFFSEGVPVNRPSQVLAPPSESGLPPIPSSRTRPSPNGPGSPQVLEMAGNAQITERTGVRKALGRLTVLANQAGVVLLYSQSCHRARRVRRPRRHRSGRASPSSRPPAAGPRVEPEQPDRKSGGLGYRGP